MSRRPSKQEYKEVHTEPPPKPPNVPKQRPMKTYHYETRASPLSTEAPPHNYRGIVNLTLLVLFVTHIRLVIENVLKYGLLFSWKTSTFDYSKSIKISLVYNVFILVAYIIEKLVEHKKITEKTTLISHVVNTIFLLAIPIYLVEATDANPATGLVVLMLAIVLWMKLVSYAFSNKEYRATLEAGSPFSEKPKDNDHLITYPHNLTLTNMYYFILAPTLIYQLNYPRSPRIRPLWLAKRCLELVFYMALMLFLIEQYMVPTVRNAIIPLNDLDLLRLVERVMKLSIPTLYIWLIGFYSLFHLWLNILAEILRFGDRYFYGCWWNSTTMDEYWRIWNIPVHTWLVKHIYHPLCGYGVPKFWAGVCVFFVSAVFHELLVSVPVHTFRFWAFIGMMGNIPLIAITNFFFKNSQIGNALFWFSFCFLGQPLCILLYYNDYSARQHIDINKDTYM